MIINKINKRKCQMVLFQLEESLGDYVSTHAANDRVIPSLSEGDELKKAVDAIESAYLDEIFRYALDISKNTSDYAYVVSLYNKFNELSLFEVRNSLAHPNRIFNDNYWYKVATIASDPTISLLNLTDVTSALISAEN